MGNKKIAVCIPVYNEEKNIYTLIKSIVNQDLNREITILIVASGCTDRTIPEIKRAKSDFGEKIITKIEKNRLGKSKALNICLNYLRDHNFKYAFFIDGDVILQSNSLSLLFNEMEKRNLDSICSNPEPLSQNNKLGNKVAWENCRIWDEIRVILDKTNENWALTGYLFLVIVSSLPQAIPIGIINDDAYTGLSLLHNKKTIGYKSTSKVFVKFPENLSDYFLQKLRVRSGWDQLKQFDKIRITELRLLQKRIAIQRFLKGNTISLVCLFLNEIDFAISYIYKKRPNGYIWPQIKSTK